MKEFTNFQNYRGDISFLVGVADTSSDLLLTAILPSTESAEVDVLDTENTPIELALKDRLELYDHIINDKNWIRLVPIIEEDVVSFIKKHFAEIAQEKLINIDQFFTSLEVYMGKPQKLFEVEKGVGKLEKAYIGILFKVFIIEYDFVSLLMVFCTSE